MATRVKNGRKEPRGSKRKESIDILKRRNHLTQAQAEAEYKKLATTTSKRVRNYKKLTGAKTGVTTEDVVYRHLRYGGKDEFSSEIMKIPATNPKVSKAQAGGDIERYAETTKAATYMASANAWFVKFIPSLQTAGKGSNLRRIWETFTQRVYNETLEGRNGKAGLKLPETFWADFDSVGVGLFPAEYGLPKNWKVSEEAIKWLIRSLTRWSRDYKNATKGGGGAGADGGGGVNPTYGS